MLGWFRRHATILMVVLGSAAMVIFGLGSVFDSIANSASRGVRDNPTIAEWKDGKLTQDDVDRVYRSHAESARFLGAVVEAAEEKSGDRITPLADPIMLIRAKNDEDRMTQMLGRMMLAQAAEKQGFVVSDRMVTEYIALVSGDAHFSNADLEVINGKVNQSSLDIVKKHLQVELMAMQMGSLSNVGMNLPPNPTEAISLYGRTAERIECEVIPIPVEDFLGKVTATPSDSDLRKLYKEGKDDLPDFLGEKPGFKADRKINVQYFVAKAETFLQNEMNKITDEDVQKEYDRLVEKNDVRVVEPLVKDNSFAIPGLDSLPGMSNGDSTSNPDDAPALPNDDAPVLPNDGAPVLPSNTVPVPNEAPAGQTAPATEVTPSMEVTPGAEVPQIEVPQIEVPQIETAPVAPQGSHVVRGTRAQFVSVQAPAQVLTPSDVQEVTEQLAVQAVEQAVEQPAAQTIIDVPAQAVQPAVESAAGLQPQAAPVVGETTPAIPQLPAATTESVELPQANLPQAGGIGSDIDEELKKQEAAPARKYKPLIDVAETIRRSMALPIANAKMLVGLDDAKHEVEDYFYEMENWEREGNDPNTKPPVPDFEAIAKKYKLQVKQTGLVNRDEMKVDPLGSVQRGIDVTLSNDLFGIARDVELYEPTSFVPKFEPNYYVFWNIENEKPHVVEFAECKDQVVEFWKKQQALELAEKEAASISNNANDNRKSKLSELYPDRALQTGQFSWFDRSRGGIGKPGNVEKPSNDFMETAFSLAELEAGVAVDRNRDTVYVIQSISGNRPVEELGADYLQNQFMKFKEVPTEVRGAAYYYFRLEQAKAGTDLKEQLGFEYNSENSN